jgi:hypothetical protein
MKIPPLILLLVGAVSLCAQQPATPPASTTHPSSAPPPQRILFSKQATPGPPTQLPRTPPFPPEALARVEIVSLPHILARKVQRQPPKNPLKNPAKST